ncbi:MAG: 16S rRNA (cytidine(1402)-2'-O)-methyltransferase [Spirochaetales bacterium]|nr:16S rRNA (cytidine(1402)-2'-O)-methyltransferase [Spirochaetales bacterium]
MDSEPNLYFIATPIGNMEDLSHRALRLLGECAAIGCEDTRVTKKIFQRYNIRGDKFFFPYHEHNEQKMEQKILDMLAEGQKIAIVTDAGMPGISDPGFRLAFRLHQEGIPYDVIPGPSAVSTALLLSGMPCSSYTFKGFPPRKSGQRQNFFAMDKETPHSLVFFESPFRIGKSLADAYAALGNRLAAVCLELTKKFQRVHRGFLADLVPMFEDKEEKGEATIVIAGNNKKFFGPENGQTDSQEEPEINHNKANKKKKKR